MVDDGKAGNGKLGFDIAGGRGIEFSVFDNRIIQGVMIQAPTTPSSQLTGAGNGTYLYNITEGLVAVGGEILEVDAAADQALEAPADIMPSGQSKIYTFVYYKSTGDSVARLRIFKGVPATTGSQVSVTDAEIEAVFGSETSWFRIAEVTINRTADTTVTQSKDNTVRPTLIPERINK